MPTLLQVQAAKAEYARWSTAFDSRRRTNAWWVARQAYNGEWIETTTHSGHDAAQQASHEQALSAAIDAALAAQPVKQGGAGAGWRWVPETPTSEMVDAGSAARGNTGVLDGRVNTIATYRAALAAAPTPPAGEAVGGERKRPAYLSEEEARNLAASERVSAAQAVYDDAMSDYDPHATDHEVHLFDAMAAALAAADAVHVLRADEAVSPTSPTDDLAKLSAGATPGPWRHIVGDDYYIESDSYPPRATHNPCVVDTGWWLAVGNRPDDYGEANSKFIVAVVNAYRDGRLVPAPAAPQATQEPVEGRGLPYDLYREITRVYEGFAHIEEIASFAREHVASIFRQGSLLPTVVEQELTDAVEAALDAEMQYDHNLPWSQFAKRIGAEPKRKRMRAILKAAAQSVGVSTLYAAPAASRIGVSEEEIAERLSSLMCHVTSALRSDSAVSKDLALMEVERRLPALLAAPRAGGETREEWQPIETAPKDGTRILVEFDRNVGVHAVAWEESVSGSECWCVDDNKHGPYALRGYTKSLRWRSLPAPPAEQDASRREGR